MTLLHIGVFGLLAVLAGRLRRGRAWLLLIVSVLAVYWLQPSTPIRHLDFWLPTVTLGLVAGVWAATHPAAPGEKGAGGEGRANWLAAAVIGGIILLVGLTRYLGPVCCLTPTRPPDIWQAASALAAAGLLIILARRWGGNRLTGGLVWALLALFVALKTQPLALAASLGLRSLAGQSTSLASALDIRWLGFSYVAFRLIHTLRDRLTGRLPGLGLGEFVVYAIFFPALTAGPIDRIQRFTQDLRQGSPPDPASLWDGGQRIVLGIFKKFALADSLALIALDEVNAAQALTGWGLWALLYAYALRIYFDFSGYTDIAIGLGRLMGFALPENFERPYLKPNLTTFWNSWHITLAQWFRAYYFNPLTRALRTASRPLPLWTIILIGQVSTMLLIGLWHGVTGNFALWGLWHGLGLFVHNRWVEATRARLAILDRRPRLQRGLSIAGALLTFHYVALGWVWFALPSVERSWNVFQKLFGFG